MKQNKAYLLGALSAVLLALPTQASVIINPSSQTVNPAVLCEGISSSDTTLLENTANRDSELAMDTEDAILTGVLGAAIIGAAVIVSNNERHQERTVIVEQAPPPPPPSSTVIVHETRPAPPGPRNWTANGAPSRHRGSHVVHVADNGRHGASRSHRHDQRHDNGRHHHQEGRDKRR